MKLVSIKLEEGQKMTRLQYVGELDYTVRTPLKVAAEALYFLSEHHKNSDARLSDVYVTLETILARWDDLDSFYNENKKPA